MVLVPFRLLIQSIQQRKGAALPVTVTSLFHPDGFLREYRHRSNVYLAVIA